MLYPKRNFSYFSVRDDFSRWLYSRVSKPYAKKLISYLDRFAKDRPLTTPRDLYEIREASTSKKQMTIALRNLLNYAEEFELIDDYTLTKMRKILKSVRSNPDNYIPSTERVIEVYNKIEYPEYKLLYRILAYSGLRIIEGVSFLHNYNPQKLVVKENFIRYPLFHIRGSKNSYYVYLPLELKNELRQIDISHVGFKNYIYRRGLAGKYLRKWNYNFLIMHNVPESVADFIQGRSPISIGSMHYLAKVKQADYWYGIMADRLEEIFACM